VRNFKISVTINYNIYQQTTLHRHKNIKVINKQGKMTIFQYNFFTMKWLPLRRLTSVIGKKNLYKWRCKQPTSCNSFRFLIFLLIYLNCSTCFERQTRPSSRALFDCICGFWYNAPILLPVVGCLHRSSNDAQSTVSQTSNYINDADIYLILN